ncbi:unknown [Firmicutes bacterium CAG:102]|jgi:hypothetical protein|uniref:Uncharacterized protein n=1 Tax=Anaerotignum faecicola TaxID=2358141 RepID=A0A401LEJ1_9FIRM|nr:hypothetical protein [Anaerotignum faecicola]GCB29943.1 hypothetical protein KGMB03357_16040 [Anaerotignum faecicola]CCX40729.1 unknown [Firmicutes bacterium CAG:102]
MKKIYIKAICLMLVMTSMPVSAYASTTQKDNNIVECQTTSLSPYADVKRYVHKTTNGVTMHRVWNETKGQFEGLWTICNCK